MMSQAGNAHAAQQRSFAPRDGLCVSVREPTNGHPTLIAIPRRLLSLSPTGRGLFSHQRNHYPLDPKFTRRGKIWIGRILGLEVGTTMLENISLQRRLTVDQGSDDISILHIFSVFQDDHIAVQDVSVYHRIAPHPKRERAPVL